MALPKVTIEQTSGNLGRIAPSTDGIAGIVVSAVAVGKLELGEVHGPILSPEGADVYGINAAYDADNSLLAYQHILDFYKEAPAGTELYIMPVADTVLMADICDTAQPYLKKLIEESKCKIWGVTRVPDAAYVPVYAGQFEEDLFTAIANAQVLADELNDVYLHTRGVIEGRDFQGNMATSRDLRSDDVDALNANRVMVVAGSDLAVSEVDAAYETYAEVGLVLGAIAASHVGRSIARVKSGARTIERAGLSNGMAVETFSATELDAFSNKGYVFAFQYTGRPGYYFTKDHMATPITDDYAYMRFGRTIDKASRLLYNVYLEELEDDFEVEETGKLPPVLIKSYQENAEEEVRNKMRGEITSVNVYVNPDQDVIATEETEVEATIVPKGVNAKITVKLGFRNPAN